MAEAAGSRPSYSELLKDDRWYAKREEVFERDGNRCLRCPATEPLHCHHLWYEPDREPWDYPLEAFATLCRTCHKDVEAKLRLLRKAMPLDRLEEVVGFALGLRSLEHPGDAVYVSGARMALGIGAAYGLDPGQVVRATGAKNLTTGARLAAALLAADAANGEALDPAAALA